jgi:quercetin dioxygenase-like cupin family protein
MIIKKLKDIPIIKLDGLEGLTKQIAIGAEDGSKEIVMRYFTLEPGKSSPHHAHDYPHLIRIEAGEGSATDHDGNEHAVEYGDFIYVPDNSIHHLSAGKNGIAFICIVPARGEV